MRGWVYSGGELSTSFKNFLTNLFFLLCVQVFVLNISDCSPETRVQLPRYVFEDCLSWGQLSYRRASYPLSHSFFFRSS